jgi:hypothetical protein
LTFCCSHSSGEYLRAFAFSAGIAEGAIEAIVNHGNLKLMVLLESWLDGLSSYVRWKNHPVGHISKNRHVRWSRLNMCYQQVMHDSSFHWARKSSIEMWR